MNELVILYYITDFHLAVNTYQAFALCKYTLRNHVLYYILSY